MKRDREEMLMVLSGGDMDKYQTLERLSIGKLLNKLSMFVDKMASDHRP